MRIHGRAGIAYLSLRSGDPATPVAFLSDWTIQYTRELYDTTTIVDPQHVYTAGTVNTEGSFSGFYDTATAQTYTAAVDGLPRNLYIYPSVTNISQFFSGSILPDFNLGAGAGAAVALSVSWTGSGPVIKTDGVYTAVYTAVY